MRLKFLSLFLLFSSLTQAATVAGTYVGKVVTVRRELKLDLADAKACLENFIVIAGPLHSYCYFQMEKLRDASLSLRPEDQKFVAEGCEFEARATLSERLLEGAGYSFTFPKIGDKDKALKCLEDYFAKNKSMTLYHLVYATHPK